MVKRIKSKAAGPVPQDQAQARDYVLRIGQHQNNRKRIVATMDDQIQRIRDKYQVLAAKETESIDELSHGVQVWCEANRDKLTNNGKRKSADLGAGVVQWRTTPPKVSVRNSISVIERLTNLGLQRFLRKKIEVNKDAIREEPEAVKDIKGISITQGEDFVIKPHETDLEEVA